MRKCWVNDGYELDNDLLNGLHSKQRVSCFSLLKLIEFA